MKRHFINSNPYFFQSILFPKHTFSKQYFFSKHSFSKSDYSVAFTGYHITFVSPVESGPRIRKTSEHDRKKLSQSQTNHGTVRKRHDSTDTQRQLKENNYKYCWFHMRGFAIIVNFLLGFTIFVNAWFRLDTDVQGQV